MDKSHVLLIALLAGAGSAVAAAPGDDTVAPAASTAPKPQGEMQIAFANHGGIWNWEVMDSKTILIEDRARRWYKATLSVNCVDLPFAQKVGFESNPDGSFDKFSAIQTRQQYCPLQSLVRTDAPLSKKAKAAAAKSAAAAAKPSAPLPAPAGNSDVKPIS